MKLYMVMKLVTEVAVGEHTGTMTKGEYMIPAFESLDDANMHSEDGKYQIMVVKTVEVKK